MIPGSGRSSGGGNGNPLQYSFLGNPVERGVWWATVHGSQRVRHAGTTTYLHRSRQMINEERVCVCVCVSVCVCAQSCPTLGHPVDCSPPGSFLHGISQARILVYCRFLLQEIFPTKGLSSCLAYLLRWLVGSLPRSHRRGHKDSGLLINEWMWLKVLELLGGMAVTMMQEAKQAF